VVPDEVVMIVDLTLQRGDLLPQRQDQRLALRRFPAERARLLVEHGRPRQPPLALDLGQRPLERLSVAAYVLFQVLQLAARATALGAAQIWILRERLLKVAVWVERSVRRIVLHLPQSFPWRAAWQHLAHALGAT